MTCSQISRGGKGERPVGVPAALGHWGNGGADIRCTLRSPEHDLVCRGGVRTSIGRSADLGSVRKYSKGGSRQFRFGRGGKVKKFNARVRRGTAEKNLTEAETITAETQSAQRKPSSECSPSDGVRTGREGRD